MLLKGMGPQAVIQLSQISIVFGMVVALIFFFHSQVSGLNSIMYIMNLLHLAGSVKVNPFLLLLSASTQLLSGYGSGRVGERGQVHSQVF